MRKSRMTTEHYQNFKNFFEWFKLERESLTLLIATNPLFATRYEEVCIERMGKMLSMMLPKNLSEIPMVSSAKDNPGVTICECMEFKALSNMGEPVLWPCDEHRERFDLYDKYWEDEIAYFIRIYTESGDSKNASSQRQSDEDFLREAGIIPS